MPPSNCGMNGEPEENVLRKIIYLAFGLLGLLILAACNSTTSAAPAPTATATLAPAVSMPSTVAILTPTKPASVGLTIPTVSNPLNALKPTGTPLPATASGIPAFTHIYVIIMENKEYGSVVGNRTAPFINSLIAQYGLATDYTAVTHPSEPNYFALFAASTEGATGDGVYNLAGPNLADQIEQGGKTWQVFAQNVPTGCFAGAVATDGEDGSGTYARKHEPAISFTDISGSATRCANITDLKHFDAKAANYELIAPNLCNDMHDCAVATGDKFLQDFVPQITNSDAWQNGGVLFIVWDEGTSGLGGGGRVPLLVISKQVAKGTTSAVAHNHYSLVRTIEDAWGLPCLNAACQANNLADFFK